MERFVSIIFAYSFINIFIIHICIVYFFIISSIEYIYLFIYLFVHSFIYLILYLFAYLFNHLLIYLLHLYTLYLT